MDSDNGDARTRFHRVDPETTNSYNLRKGDQMKYKELIDEMVSGFEYVDVWEDEEGWERFNEDVLLNTIKSSTKEEIPLYIKNLVKDQSISLIAPLPPNLEWKKFGYKYFNPEDRAFFASLFKHSYLATDSDNTYQNLTQIF